MFRFIAKLLGILKNKAFKVGKNFLKRQFNFKRKLKALTPTRIAKRFNPLNRIKNIRNITSKIINRFGAKNKLIDKILDKARLIENLVKYENELISQKSNFIKTYSQMVDDISKKTDILKLRSEYELELINKAIDKELKSLGIKSAEDIGKALKDEEFFNDLIINNSYKDFMENWKDGFFAYNPEVLGMSEDERELIWSQIEETWTYDHFVENKVE